MTDLIGFNCQHCGNRLETEIRNAGKDGWCRVCGGFIIMPLRDGTNLDVNRLSAPDKAQRLDRLLRLAFRKIQRVKLRLLESAGERGAPGFDADSTFPEDDVDPQRDPTPPPSGAALHQLLETSDILREKLRQAEAQLEELTNVNDNLTGMLADGDAQLAVASGEARHPARSGSDTAQAEAEALRAELDDVSGTLEALRSTEAEQLTTIQTLESQLKAERAAHSGSDTAQAEAEALRTELDDVSGKLEALRSTEAEQLTTIQTLESQLKAERAAHSESDTVQAETEALRAELDEVSGKLEALRSAEAEQAKAVQSLESQLKAARSESDTVQAETEALRAELDDVSAKLEALRSAEATQIATMQTLEGRLKAERAARDEVERRAVECPPGDSGSESSVAGDHTESTERTDLEPGGSSLELDDDQDSLTPEAEEDEDQVATLVIEGLNLEELAEPDDITAAYLRFLDTQ